ncbi:MAG: sigma-70 family RNA polymerase sigma factor [Planctomycetaceae bacterium]|nr:sigma-70 family RNA polymerase sigma factor [Planctomycetaceae bacterium]
MTERPEELETRKSLLLRLKDRADESAWHEFHGLYAPLIYNYARARGLPHDDAEEIRSDCLVTVVKQMPTFDYDPQKGRFKAWLRTIVVRRIADRLRKRAEPQAGTEQLYLITSQDETSDEIWESEWRDQHLRTCMDHARSHVNDQTWAIFQMLVDDGLDVAEICRRMNVAANLVYKARARVLELVRSRMAYLEASDAV